MSTHTHPPIRRIFGEDYKLHSVIDGYPIYQRVYGNTTRTGSGTRWLTDHTGFRKLSSARAWIASIAK